MKNYTCLHATYFSGNGEDPQMTQLLDEKM
jgi:hypothetical protein